MPDLPKPLLDDAAAASDELAEVRVRARAEAVAAVRRMEGALVEALGGDNLRGLPALLPGFSAARARGEAGEELPEPRASELCGREALVVSPKGRLEMARAYRVPGSARLRAETRPADDSDLLVEDVEHLARLFASLLRAHVERSRATAEKFGRLEGIAQRISAALLAAS